MKHSSRTVTQASNPLRLKNVDPDVLQLETLMKQKDQIQVQIQNSLRKLGKHRSINSQQIENFNPERLDDAYRSYREESTAYQTQRDPIQVYTSPKDTQREIQSFRTPQERPYNYRTPQEKPRHPQDMPQSYRDSQSSFQREQYLRKELQILNKKLFDLQKSQTHQPPVSHRNLLTSPKVSGIPEVLNDDYYLEIIEKNRKNLQKEDKFYKGIEKERNLLQSKSVKNYSRREGSKSNKTPNNLDLNFYRKVSKYDLDSHRVNWKEYQAEKLRQDSHNAKIAKKSKENIINAVKKDRLRERMKKIENLEKDRKKYLKQSQESAKKNQKAISSMMNNLQQLENSEDSIITPWMLTFEMPKQMN